MRKGRAAVPDSPGVGLTSLFADCCQPRNFGVEVERGEELNPLPIYFLAALALPPLETVGVFLVLHLDCGW